MVEESVRKTVAKKTVRKAVARTATVKRAPRTRKVVESDIDEVESTPVRPRARRKAPTPVAETVAMQKRTHLILIIGIAVFVLFFIISAIIGFTDRGAINVKAIIDERIASASPDERARLEQAQKSSAGKNLPDGGLVPSGVPEEPVQPTATTSPEIASTTTPTATTTDAVDAEAAAPTEVISESELVPAETVVQ